MSTLHAFDKNTATLGVEQIDLLILHQPMPTAFNRPVAPYKALETSCRPYQFTIAKHGFAIAEADETKGATP